jgi:hypothetical protein
MKTITITAKKLIVEHGPAYQLRDNHGNLVGDEGHIYDTKIKALTAVESMYPRNSVWRGERTGRGWKIVID